MQGIRASDADRADTIARLREHHLAGRLNVETFEARVAHAERAERIAELDAVLHDLPNPPARAASPDDDVTTRVPFWPGMRAFEERKVLGDRYDAAIEQIRELVAPKLERYDYLLHGEDEGTFVFVNRFSAAARITVRLRPTWDGRTRLTAHGYAPLAVRRAFATIDG